MKWSDRPSSRVRDVGPLVVVALVLLAASSRGADDSLVVGVSVPPQAYLVERIGGERVEVLVMVPPGASPATYEPTPQQLVELGRASLYVKVGHPDFLFERRHLATLLKVNPEIPILDMAATMEGLCQGERSAELDGDPHLWLSPRLMRAAAAGIEDELLVLDPAGAPLYRRNLQALLVDIDRLDLEIGELVAGLQGRRFMVFHPAWSYFACDYGLRQMAIEAGGKEPSPAQLVATIQAARRAGIGVIFVQRGFSDRSARVIAAEIGARIEVLDPMAHDWLENLRSSADRIAAAVR